MKVAIVFPMPNEKIEFTIAKRFIMSIKIFRIITILLLSLFLISCLHDEKPDPPETEDACEVKGTSEGEERRACDHFGGEFDETTCECDLDPSSSLPDSEETQTP